MIPPLIKLLQAEFGAGPALELPSLGRADVHWLIETGLAPVLWSYLQTQPGQISAADQQTVKAADLTARLLAEDIFDSLAQIQAAAAQEQIPMILLKGVSVAQQWYPRRHWRPMRDIDILVRADDLARMEDSLRKLGYRQQGTRGAEFFIGHQHSMPFFRDDPPCWIEVHTTLFRAGSAGAQVPAFQRERLFDQSVAFAGPDVRCFTPEMQLVYTAVHWGSKLTQVGGLLPLLDIVLLLKKAEMDWDKVLMICRHPVAARHLYLVLSWLHRQRLVDVPDSIWLALEPGRRSLTDIGVRMLHDIIDSHLVQGQLYKGLYSEALVNVRWETLLGDEPPALKLLKLPWRLLFPPQAENRYQLGRQLRRLSALWRKE